MITELLYFESNNRVEEIYLEQYNRNEIVFLDKKLGDRTGKEYVEEIVKRMRNEPDDLLLLVVRFIVFADSSNVNLEYYKTFRKNHKLF